VIYLSQIPSVFGLAKAEKYVVVSGNDSTIYNKALAINPKYENALYDKGLVLSNLGNYTGALISLDKALAIDPKDEDALYQKGVVFDKLGNHTGAILYYDKAKAIKS
jgi:tetratricopeptide (TPR) repeat protein